MQCDDKKNHQRHPPKHILHKMGLGVSDHATKLCKHYGLLHSIL